MLVPNLISEKSERDIRPKILELDDLAACLSALRSGGKRIVHCHGVFDILHAGHIRHFAAAKAMGDVLVVTLTPDRYVNKGPDRPAFTETLRAEVIAALDAVDFVAVNRWPTATETIHLLRPHVYAKGQDYQDAEKDVSGGIEHEAAAVAAVGGEIKFTQDITFSSSNLVNRFFSGFPPEVNQFLEEFRQRHSADEINGYLAELAKLRVLVVGEAILDEYVYCDPLSRSGKEPILAMRYLSRELYAGGSLAICNHLADFVAGIDLLTGLGTINPHEDFVRARLASKVKPRLVSKSDSPTIIKRRYVEGYSLSKLFEVYEINDEPLGKQDEERFCNQLEELIEQCDVAIVSDFGHGLITP
ncbi:MAG: adenylyltransferase/cytidyltransferase family protein, partial [Chloroflexota bacterium]|nr:adenylyltransferase/cytidyltransferase family protein [Chloroflexota bacterium]